MLKSLLRDRVLHATLLGALVFYGLLLHWQGYRSGIHISAGQLPQFLLLVLLYPLLEEFIFRGLIQGGLRKYRPCRKSRKGISVANVLTSILFAALHLIAHPVLWAASVFVPSVLLGYFRDRYKSLIPSMVLHVGFNFGYFVIAGLPA